MKRCSFCSNVIEDHIAKCPYCGHETQNTDFPNQETAEIFSAQQAVSHNSQTPSANQGFSATSFYNLSNNQNSTNLGATYQTGHYASGMNRPGASLQPPLSSPGDPMPWKLYYKTNANVATKVAVIICAVFSFFGFVMEIAQLIAMFAANANFEMSTFLIAVLALEFIAYVGGGVLLLVTKKWWAAAITCGVAFLLMVYNLVVNQIFTSYLVVAFSVWAIVSLILLEKKFKNEENR